MSATSPLCTLGLQLWSHAFICSPAGLDGIYASKSTPLCLFTCLQLWSHAFIAVPGPSGGTLLEL